MTLSTTTRIDHQAVRPARGDTRRAVWAIMMQVLGWPLRVHRARQLMTQMGRMDYRELRDLGLVPQDLHDTLALGLDADPSLLWRRRAEERRRHS